MKLSDLKKQKPSQEDILGILNDIAEKSRSDDTKKATNYLINMINNENMVPNKKTIEKAITQIRQAYPEEGDNLHHLNESINNMLADRMQNFVSQFDDIIQSFKNEEKKQNADPVPPVTNNDTNASANTMEIEIDNLIQGLGKKQNSSATADNPADAKDTTTPSPIPPIPEGGLPPLSSKVDLGPPPPPNAAPADIKVDEAPVSDAVDAAPNVNAVDAAPIADTINIGPPPNSPPPLPPDAAPNNTADAAPDEKADVAPTPNASDLPPPPNVPPPPPPIEASEDAKINTVADNASVETRARANAVSGKDAKTDAQAAMSEVRNEQRKGWDKLIKAHRNKNMDEKKDAAPNAVDTTNDSRLRAASIGSDEKKQLEQADNASANAQNSQKSASPNNASIKEMAKSQSTELYKSNKVMVEVLQFVYRAARFVGNLTKSEKNAAMQDNHAIDAIEQKQNGFKIDKVKSYFSVQIFADLLGEQKTKAIKEAVNAVVDKAASLKKSIIVLGGDPEAKQALTNTANKKGVPNQISRSDEKPIFNPDDDKDDIKKSAPSSLSNTRTRS